MAAMPRDEVKAIRFFEHIIAPVLVLSVVALFATTINLGKAVAQMETKQGYDDKAINNILNFAISNQTALSGVRLSITTQNLKQENLAKYVEKLSDSVDRLKENNQEILNILRDIRDGSSAGATNND